MPLFPQNVHNHLEVVSGAAFHTATARVVPENAYWRYTRHGVKKRSMIFYKTPSFLRQKSTPLGVKKKWIPLVIFYLVFSSTCVTLNFEFSSYSEYRNNWVVLNWGGAYWACWLLFHGKTGFLGQIWSNDVCSFHCPPIITIPRVHLAFLEIVVLAFLITLAFLIKENVR